MNDLLVAKIQDKLIRAEKKNIPVAFGFLDPAEQAAARQILQQQHTVRYFFSGGFSGAERAFLFLLPDYLEEETFPVSDYIAAFAAKVPFGVPTHRDFLGSLLGLGITRECVGDILVSETETVLIVAASLAPFVRENLKKVSRYGVSLREIGLDEISPIEEPFEEITATVASLRLDAVAAAAFHVSRTVTAEAIASGLLALNWIPNFNPAAEVSERDLISWRGHGRARLASCGGMSKKGRQFLTLHLYAKRK